MSNYIIIYITCKDHAEAVSIGKYLLNNRLVACINIIKHVDSMYHWEGDLEIDNESLLVGKTEQRKLAQIVNEVTEIHSYDVPCIIALPVLSGNPEYLQWITNELDGTKNRTL